MKLPKVKVKELNAAELASIKAANIKKAKDFLVHTPFATMTYLALQTRLPIGFIQDNREEIGI